MKVWARQFARGLLLTAAIPASAPAWAGSPTPPGLPAPLETTATSADSDDLVSAPAPQQVASLPDEAAAGSDAAAAPEADASGGGDGRRVQLAQLELTIPPPVFGYQPPVDQGPVPVQDSLQLDIERSMAAIEAESSPTLQGGLVFRGRDGTDGLSSLIEFATPIEGRFSPWLTGTMTLTATPIFLDAGTPDSAAAAQFGANPMLAAFGLRQVNPGEQNAAGVMLSAGYAYGPFSGRIGEMAFGFPVTNIVGNVAYQPHFMNDQLTLRIEGLREPITDSLLSYAGTKANLFRANTVTNNAFGNGRTWGGVVKSGVRGGVFYDDNDIGAFGSIGGSFLTGTNVAQNGEIEAVFGAYFRPYRSDTDALRVGVTLNYFGFDRNLSFYTYGQGGYFSPQDYEAITFPVEYQARHDRWSYLVSVALGVQHFNAERSPFFPNNPFAQQALVNSGSTAYYGAVDTVGLATNLRGQIEYAVDNSLSIGAAAQFDNGHDYNEGIVKLYLRKTFSDPPPITPILPGSPMGTVKTY